MDLIVAALLSLSQRAGNARDNFAGVSNAQAPEETMYALARETCANKFAGISCAQAKKVATRAKR